MIWWFASAHKWFKGPKVNLQHLMMGREDQLGAIQGEEVRDGLLSGEGGDLVGRKVVE